jgi:hypothetical protein
MSSLSAPPSPPVHAPAPPRRPLASVAGVTADGQRPMVQAGALAANNHLHQPPNGGGADQGLNSR